MTPILAHISPFDVVAGARVDVRVASSLETEAYGLNGLSWAPAIVDRPQLSIEIMSIDLSGRVQVGRARLSVALANAGISPDRVLKWGGAPIKIYSAKALAWPAPTEFDGEITDHSFDLDTGLLTITAEVSTSLIEKPLLTLEFDGSGGIGGEAEKRGTLKPAGFGACENIPPIWFDTVRNIGMIDGYGNTTAITRLMEGASDMGVSVGNYASYAALAAAIDSDAVPPGRWATCIAEGLVGLGAPPVGVIGVNATFGQNRLGGIMNRILQTHAGVSAGDIDTASFTALDAALNYPAHYWTDSQIECKALLESMARSCNSTLVITFQRKIAISRATASAPVATLDRSGKQAPRCIDWRILSPQRPIWRLKARAARPAQVLTLDQVNYVDTIIDRGLYNASTVYRAGNVVWLADKSSWLYINSTANSGNAPPVWPTTSNAYWQVLTPPATAASVTYADGTSLEALKPADPGATAGADIGVDLRLPSSIPTAAELVTSLGTAAAIAGQGDLATANRATLAFGENAIVNSDFARGIYGWTFGAAATSAGINLPGWFGFRNVLWFSKPGTLASGATIDTNQTGVWNGGTNALQKQFGVPVKQGDRVYIRALLAQHRCIAEIIPLVFDKDGTFLEAVGFTGAASGGGANGAPANFNVVGGLFTVSSANAASLGFMVRMTGTGENDPYVFMAEPAMGIVPSGQTVLPPYQPGRSDPIADQTNTNTAAAISGQTAWATYAGDTPTTYTLRVQYLDTSGQLSALDRVVDRRMTLLRRADGSTALTEAMAITALGTAAAIAGQGVGATSNSLSDLDPTAASQLATAYAGGVMTVGYTETLKRKIAVSGTLSLSAQVSVAAGGSTSGNIKARIESSLFGANSWSTVSTGPGASVTPTEPGLDETSGTFTNSTGIEQMFEFRVVIVRTPGTAGGAVITSESFLTG